MISAFVIGVSSIPTNFNQNKESAIFPTSSATALNQTSPLFIANNSVLDAYCVNGTGTIEDPHIFENYTFTFEFNTSSTGILISPNVTEHFVIRNVTITNNGTGALGTGITIQSNVGMVHNCTIENVQDGINLQGSNLMVNSTSITANRFGLYAEGIENTTISLSIVIGAMYGMFLESCDNLLLDYNILSGTGIDRTQSGISGIQLYSCTNFVIQRNIIATFSSKGLIIVETPPKSGLVNLVVNNQFIQNGINAQLITNEVNTRFYNETSGEGNVWDDWRGWGKYKTTTFIDPHPMKVVVQPTTDIRETVLAPAVKLSFKFWFWIFAPIIVVLAATGYFIYWKLYVQPKVE
jgi:hypothetical protein